jgi:hypothetical protein
VREENKYSHQPDTKGLNVQNEDISKGIPRGTFTGPYPAGNPLVYVDAQSMKKTIIRENTGKSGIYM